MSFQVFSNFLCKKFEIEFILFPKKFLKHFVVFHERLVQKLASLNCEHS